SLLPFNASDQWASKDLPIRSGKDQLDRTIESLFAENGTALYDSIGVAYDHLLEQKQAGHNDRILAVVVLTDGADTDSKTRLEELMNKIRYDGETRTIHVFTIAYGNDARKDILKQIAEATQAKSYEGSPRNVIEVFKDISTFF